MVERADGSPRRSARSNASIAPAGCRARRAESRGGPTPSSRPARQRGHTRRSHPRRPLGSPGDGPPGTRPADPRPHPPDGTRPSRRSDLPVLRVPARVDRGAGRAASPAWPAGRAGLGATASTSSAARGCLGGRPAAARRHRATGTSVRRFSSWAADDPLRLRWPAATAAAAPPGFLGLGGRRRRPVRLRLRDPPGCASGGRGPGGRCLVAAFRWRGGGFPAAPPATGALPVAPPALTTIDLARLPARAPTTSAAIRRSSHGKPDPAVGSVGSELFWIVIAGVVPDFEPREPAAFGWLSCPAAGDDVPVCVAGLPSVPRVRSWRTSAGAPARRPELTETGTGAWPQRPSAAATRRARAAWDSSFRSLRRLVPSRRATCASLSPRPGPWPVRHMMIRWACGASDDTHAPRTRTSLLRYRFQAFAEAFFLGGFRGPLPETALRSARDTRALIADGVVPGADPDDPEAG